MYDAGLVGFVVVVFVATAWTIERRTRDDDFSATVRSVETLLDQKIATATGLMRATLTALETSDEIAHAFLSKDRPGQTFVRPLRSA